MRPRVKQKINLTITSLGINGEGVGYWHGFTFFVEGALPGEVIEARVTDRQKKFGRARISTLLTRSPDRADVPCPYYDTCGGCQVMHLSASHQLKMKRQLVIDSFKKLGKIEDIEVEKCVPSPKNLQYRNKIQLPTAQKEGKFSLGLYARHSHDLTEIDHCLVHCEKGEKVFNTVKEVLQTSGFTSYDALTGQGEIRHVLIKTAVQTSQVLVVLVTSSMDNDKLAKAASLMKQKCPEIVGVLQNINTGSTNTVLGEEFYLLEGSSYIEEHLLGLRFKISASAFFQVNPYQATQLYQKVLDLSGVQKHHCVLDAYCGVGTLALLFAQKAKEVLGIEIIPEAIQDAKINATINNLSNVHFKCAAVEDVAPHFSFVDIAVLNPPRKGCEVTVLQTLIAKRIPTLIYVSCDPGTLARDLRVLLDGGYTIECVQPFDMFPQTAHVETVVKLSYESRTALHQA